MSYPVNFRENLWCESLGMNLELVVYGHGGKPVLVFPSQNGKAPDFDNFHMIDTVGQRVDQGQLQFFAIDSVDERSVSADWMNPYDRIRIYEAWYNFVIDVMIPRIREINGSGEKLLVTGVSMGAYHAGNFFFRRPDVFDSVIALSGMYDTEDMYKGYCDEVVYANDPVKFIAGMPSDHPYIDLYNQDKIMICVGQGAWEDQLLESTRKLHRVLIDKGISAWVDYWGLDVNHDWPWWRIQFPYFISHLLDR